MEIRVSFVRNAERTPSLISKPPSSVSGPSGLISGSLIVGYWASAQYQLPTLKFSFWSGTLPVLLVLQMLLILPILPLNCEWVAEGAIRGRSS